MSSPEPLPPARAAQLALTLGALGVVFGDIGTSPLYALRECLVSLKSVDPTEGILGALSLIFWALCFEVGLKYLNFVTRADNRGEGGIFALLALSAVERKPVKRGIGPLTLVILFGAALLYGDGVITPAISVLSAAEGLKSFDPSFDPRFIIMIACAILGGIFWFQHKGTKAIGGIFGPIMLAWFLVIGGLGVWHISQFPQILAALNPARGLALLVHHPAHAVGLLGAVILAITGAEALYADLGHFGRKHVTAAWYWVVFPGLTLNYFGQGAYVLSHPASSENPFFALAPDGPLRLALVGLSIVATIIASQALISGTYSLTRQAIQLGYFPRLKITHTNPDQVGQIYLPLVNTALAICTIWIVLAFGSSDRLAAAYGVAVTGTMLVTSVAFYQVAHRRWHWSRLRAGLLCGIFIVVETGFLFANLHKFSDGGWLPIAIALGLLAIMHTWKSGRTEIQEKVYSGAINELELAVIARSHSIVRVPGSAVFMAASPKGVPLALLHHLKSNKCLQKTTVLLTISFEEIPQVPPEERLILTNEGEGVWRAICYYGYMEAPDVAAVCEELKARGVPLKPQEATFYFNREMIISGGNARMWEWQKSLYAFLSRNARPVKDYYKVLPMQVIEIGLPVQL
jgi:KUP system potassium uptake protein